MFMNAGNFNGIDQLDYKAIVITPENKILNKIPKIKP
jgi:hypothetical protein